MSYEHDLLTGENTFMANWEKSLIQARKDGTLYDDPPMPEMTVAEYMEEATKHSDDLIHKWYYETRALRKEEEEKYDYACKTANYNNETASRPASAALQTSLNKPLPPLPNAPKFDYLFADAESDGSGGAMYNPSNLNFGFDGGSNDMVVDDADSPPATDPVTPPTFPEQYVVLDNSAITQHAFSQAGIHLTTKELTDNHFAAMGTGLDGGHLEVDETNEVEKDSATMGFYVDIKSEESPSPFHAPLVDKDSGFGDIREGAEHFPEQWKTTKNEPNTVTVAELEDLHRDRTYDGDIVVVHLKRNRPKSLDISKTQIKKRAARDSFETSSSNANSESTSLEHSTKKARIHEKQDNAIVIIDASCSTPLIVSPISPIYTTIVAVDESPIISPVSPIYTKITTARESVLVSPLSPIYTDPLRSPASPDWTKVSPCEESPTALPAPAKGTSGRPCYSPITPTASLITDFDEDDDDNTDDLVDSANIDETTSTANDEHAITPVTAVVSIESEQASTSKSINGYPGQFHGNNITSMMYSGAAKVKPTPTCISFGDRLHPNFLITNPSFIPDPFFPSLDIPQTNTTYLYTRFHRKLKHLNQMAEFATLLRTAKLRTKSQNDLRREAHRECAAARLEGVSVGQYRYYQGHLNVEEYKERKMCVCWDTCVCAKMCTGFGDLICPCYEMVVVHKD